MDRHNKPPKKKRKKPRPRRGSKDGFANLAKRMKELEFTLMKKKDEVMTVKEWVSERRTQNTKLTYRDDKCGHITVEGSTILNIMNNGQNPRCGGCGQDYTPWTNTEKVEKKLLSVLIDLKSRKCILKDCAYDAESLRKYIVAQECSPAFAMFYFACGQCGVRTSGSTLNHLVNHGHDPACCCNGRVTFTDERFFTYFRDVFLVTIRGGKVELAKGESDTLELWRRVIEAQACKWPKSTKMPLFCKECETVFRSTSLHKFINGCQQGCKCPLNKTERKVVEEIEKLFKDDEHIVVRYQVKAGEGGMHYDVGVANLVTKEEVVLEVDGDRVFDVKQGGHFVAGSPYQNRDLRKQALAFERSRSVIRIFQPDAYAALIATQKNKSGMSKVRDAFLTTLKSLILAGLAQTTPALFLPTKHRDKYGQHEEGRPEGMGVIFY